MQDIRRLAPFSGPAWSDNRRLQTLADSVPTCFRSLLSGPIQQEDLARNRRDEHVTMLNGSLDTVALPDVLRLIAASGKSGLLRIFQASPSGRIFIVEGRIAFVTTRDENDPIEDLLHMQYRADYVGSQEERRIIDLGELLESNPDAFSNFLEQIVVEVLSRLLGVRSGQFHFDQDVRTRREMPRTFDIEASMKKAEARIEEWERVLAVVPSTTDAFRMAPRLVDDEEVKLGRRDWALLAATGSGTSISDISQRLRIFEFAAAKKVAELAERGLIEFTKTTVDSNSVAATEALADVAGRSRAVPGEAPARSTEETVDLTEEDSVEEAEPRWVEVDESAKDEEDRPLLDELHLLIGEEPEESETEEPAPPPAPPPSPQAPAADEDDGTAEPSDDSTDEVLLEEEDIDDGADLATRWKNLRKAKRGVHASND